ncbi:MAG TPA: rRNA maturation RNase YbeY [Longimicrobiales bacterium]|nr:rRNA maturation RNase YbeY [Longimicrobiales bacterium]
MAEVLVDTGGRPDLAPHLEAAVRAVLSRHDVHDGEISVALLDDGDIRALNRDHLGHDYPTDVLSFALWEEGEPVVGDIYLGYDQALRQAGEEGIPPREELLRLAVHGTLHVLGYDHPDAPAERAASEMYREQEAILAELLASPGA